ncbi:sensor histidine kinase, partial [Bowmanella denitrificans]
MICKPALPVALLFIILLSGCYSCFAAPSTDKHAPGYALASLGVDSVQLSLLDILDKPQQYAFAELKSHTSSGRKFAATWLRFKLADTDFQDPVVVQFYYPGLYQLYFQDNQGAWHTKSFGRDIPAWQWDYAELRSAASLDQNLDVSRPFYIKIYQQGIQPIGHRLLPLWQLQRVNQLENYFWGAVLGLMLLATLIGLLIFALGREPAYLYFAGICLSSLVWSVMYLQLAHLIDSRLYAQSTLDFVFNTVIASLGFCIVQFMRHFVQFRRFSLRFDRIFGWAAKGYVASYMLVIFMTYMAPGQIWPMHIFSLFIFISGVMAILGLLLGLKRRDRTAAIMALAWIPGSSVATVSVPTYYGILPGTWLTENVVTLGLALAIVMFSVAIADQVLQLRQQRNTLLKKRNEELQLQVDKQTAHLRQKSDEIAHQHQVLATTLSYKEDLLANIAHELKTPLTLMLGVMRGSYGEGERQQKLHRLIYRISHLLDSMLDLSQAREMDKRDNAAHCYRAHEFVEFYLTTYRGFVAQGRLSLEDNPPAVVYCAPDTLDKVITNLVNNAIKYSPPGSAISIRAWLDAEHWQLDVQNGGEGIAEEQLHSVFERYVQIGEGKQSYGLGLGLPLVKQLVEAAGGGIQIWSQPGEYTRVSVRLPLAAAHQQAQEPS